VTASYIIPTAGVSETFSITLTGVTYGFTLIWRDDPCGMGGWFLDIADDIGNPLVQGLPLVTGVDLLEQYGYLNFGGQLYVQTKQDPQAVPTFTNLGTDCQLYWVIPDVLPSAIYAIVGHSAPPPA
jgi:hypothetical protein